MPQSKTPILNLEIAPPMAHEGISLKGLVSAIPAAAALVVGTGATMFLCSAARVQVPTSIASAFSYYGEITDAAYQRGPLEGTLWIFLMGLVLWLGLLLTTFLHEAGHALAALMLHWPVLEFRVSPFAVKREDGRWETRFSWRLWPAALVLADPGSTRIHSRLRLFALAGPGVNLLVAAVWIAVHSPKVQSGSALFLTLFGLTSLFIGLFNLLPLPLRGVELDGYTAFMVCRKPQLLATRVAGLRMHKHLLSGKPLESMNQRWVALAEAPANNVFQNRTGTYLAYFYWLRQQKFDRAALMLEALLRQSKNSSPEFKARLFADCAIFAALHGQKSSVHVWKERANAIPFALPGYLQHRCNCLVARADHDLMGAHREALLAREAALRLSKPVRDAFLRHWDKWIDELEKEIAALNTKNPGKQQPALS